MEGGMSTSVGGRSKRSEIVFKLMLHDWIRMNNKYRSTSASTSPPVLSINCMDI